MIKQVLGIFVLACTIFLIFGSKSEINAEVIYLKDGQVLQGNIIKDSKKSITVKTKYQTLTVLRSNIKRILYGNRQMEKIYIKKKNRSIIKGYLVDQDAEKVIIREKEDSSKEITVPKSEIKQMSRNPILPIAPGIFARVGLFYPFDIGKNEFDITWLVTGGFGINLPWLEHFHISAEVSYAKSESVKFKNQYFQFIPLQFVISYEFPIYFISFVPRIGNGFAYIEFITGEGETFQGYDYDFQLGLGVFFEIIKKSLYFQITFDYNLLVENDNLMHLLIFNGGVEYRF